jgi:RimJ/RimL family protein N-acetyltransferase
MNVVTLPLCTLRPWRPGDEEDLVRQANNPKVAAHLRDRFPQPYTLVDAVGWIAQAAEQPPGLHWAIAIDDRPMGGIGIAPGSDIHRVSAEVGYWLGESWWGRGIATCALRGLTHLAFEQHTLLNRLYALVDVDHPASIRVLENAGYRREGQLLGCALKAGQLRDQIVYAVTRGEVGRAKDEG